MPLTGEAKREYMREYMRSRRPKGRAIVAAVKDALGMRGPGRPAHLPSEATAQGQQVLQGVLRAKRFDLDKIVDKIAGQLEAERPYGKEAIMSADNDAQLRACEMGLRLHERAGTIPAATSEGHGGSHIQVIYQQITLQVPQVPDSIDVDTP